MSMPSLTNVKDGLNPYMPFSIALRSQPTRAATPAPTADPSNAAEAEILEQSIMPIRMITPAMISFARKTWPTPDIIEIRWHECENLLHAKHFF